MKVSKAVLERVFDTFQSSQDTSMAGGVYLEPDANLHVLNAFDLPLWQWSVEKNGFEKLRAHIINDSILFVEELPKIFPSLLMPNPGSSHFEIASISSGRLS
jgi:hypothetical protein